MYNFNSQLPLMRDTHVSSRKQSSDTETNSMDVQTYHDENNMQIRMKFSKEETLFPQYSFTGLNNPYFQSFSPFNSRTQTESSTDRFIPSRKHIRGMQIEQKDQHVDARDQARNSQKTQSLSDLYRKMLLTSNNQQEKKIKTFANKNKLIFKTQNQKTKLPQIFETGCPLGFTKEVSKYMPTKRKISKIPYKILDAPTLQDDYYLNLIDWSSQNVLSVGLSSCVYLWNSQNSKVTKLCEQDPSEAITSVSWSRDGALLAVGSTNGLVQVWDPVKVTKIRSMAGHSARVGSIAWNTNTFTTGSRDKNILNRDLRSPLDYFTKWSSHKQQVCGLKWSFDGQQLCSGGNDNRLLVWSLNSLNPVCKFEDHKAAVKAMAWSPHHHGLLVSGGGTADRTIRFRDTLTGTTINTVEVGSQVCNLMFSKSVNQLVSTHGYSQNQINIWKCPKMQKISTLTGHTMRVLYLSMSPDGSTIVTGAGDQTLRFWNVFPSTNQKRPKFSSTIQTCMVSLR